MRKYGLHDIRDLRENLTNVQHVRQRIENAIEDFQTGGEIGLLRRSAGKVITDRMTEQIES